MGWNTQLKDKKNNIFFPFSKPVVDVIIWNKKYFFLLCIMWIYFNIPLGSEKDVPI